MIINKIFVVLKSFIIISIIFFSIEFSFGQADSTDHQQGSTIDLEEFNVTTPQEILSGKSNKLPIANFEISTVSGGEFIAPVWLKFYPGGTYDPDGYIVLFEMDMDGDGTFDVSKNTLSGGSYEFNYSGNYTAKVRVTDDKGGVTTKSKSFTITDPNAGYNEAPKVYQHIDERNPEEIELDKKLDSIIEEFRYQDEPPTIVKNESVIVYQEPVIKEKIVQKPASPNLEINDDIAGIGSVDNDNLIVNGSFEEPIIEISHKNINKGHNIGGWTISGGSIDIVSTYFKSSDGNQSIDLHGSPGFGTIEQIIKTIPNHRYKVTFDLAGNCVGPPYIKKVQVSAAQKSANFEFDCTGNSSQKMGWTKKSWEFVAIGNSTKIYFKTLHNTGNASWGPAIDNIKVIEIEDEMVDWETPASKLIITDDTTIQLKADSYVYAYSYRNWNDANFGKHSFTSTGWHSTGGEKRTYIKFDTPNIDYEKLDKAVLKIYHHNTIGKNIHTIGVHQVLENWEEGLGTFHPEQSEPIDSSGVITWNSQPNFNDTSFTQFKPQKKSKRWLEIDITEVVNQWLKGIPNNGIMLKAEGGLSGRSPISIYKFYSREHADKTKIPNVEFHVQE